MAAQFAQFEFSLSSTGFLTLTHSFSVTSENITRYRIKAYCQKLDTRARKHLIELAVCRWNEHLRYFIYYYFTYLLFVQQYKC